MRALVPAFRQQLRRVVTLGTAIAAIMGSAEFNSAAQNSNAPARLSYDSFRSISDRNIFNPNRYARSSGRPTQRSSSQPAARVESFSLVGVMAYEKGVFAFFDGTKSDYKQALQAKGKIGDYDVVRVTPETVTLASGTNTYELRIGMQMRREDEGDWFLSEGGESPRKRIVSSRTRTRSGSSHNGASTSSAEGEAGEPEVIVIDNESQTDNNATEPAGNNGNGNGTEVNGEAARVETPAAEGETDPVLLRLMQRRQQLNQ